ncbi:adhesion G-protein coupled receptor G6-like [Paramacrobiotus metropolitanus]|uniref:adhesion G-protein coupled receptor G6-like n=1 Tax=Paramacrobiotus metropolitanus TaxID=2943436 RepID=UPI002445759C|nr:adhesion G-protein coupled receptor G6-like [Paramacrobiotus metropolitanus]
MSAPFCKINPIIVSLCFCIALSSYTRIYTVSAAGQVQFVDIKPSYEIPNRTPMDTVVAVFRATEKGKSKGKDKIVYDLYDTTTPAPFRIDRYTGQLIAAMQVNRKVGEQLKLTVTATNTQSGSNVREVIKIKITPAVNNYTPTFPSNASVILISRNATKTSTIWIADVIDADPDEVNNDIVFKEAVFSQENFLEFIQESGELKLLKTWSELPGDGITVAITACNRQDAIPFRCGYTELTVAPDIPNESDLLNNLNDIDAEKLGAVADAVANMAEYAKTNIKVAQSMVTVISAVLDVDGAKLSAAMSPNVSKRMTQSVDSYAEDAVSSANSSRTVLLSDNMEIIMMDVENVFSNESIEYLPAAGNSTQNLTFSIPQAIVRNNTADLVRVAFVVYDNTKLFKTTEQEVIVGRTVLVANQSVYIPDSPVVVAKVKDVPTEHLEEPVKYSLRKPAQGQRYKCVYWNEKDSKWDTEGVTTDIQTDDDISCSADHMTAFSVLFDPLPHVAIAAEHELILSVISYTGCGLSLFGALATAFTYCFFRQLRADRSGKILINLCCAIAGLNLTFVAASLASIAPFHVSCFVASAFIHIFVLASLLWMGIEASNMYQMLIQVFYNVNEHHFLMKRMVLGWGVPVFIAGLTMIMESYKFEEHALMDDCRLTPKNLFVYYTAFFAPLAIIIVGNTAIFIKVVFVICKPRPDFAITNKQASSKQSAVRKAQVHGSLAVMFLLGITWIFGAMAFSHGRLVFQYIFCIANSLQGFMIFVFRCLERREARLAWVRFCKTGERRPVSEASRTPTSRSVLLTNNTTTYTRRRQGSHLSDISANSNGHVQKALVETKATA